MISKFMSHQNKSVKSKQIKNMLDNEFQKYL